MKISKNLKTEHRKRVVEILSKGLSRCVDVNYKSRNISNLSKNKSSENVAYQLDILRDKSVTTAHEKRKT